MKPQLHLPQPFSPTKKSLYQTFNETLSPQPSKNPMHKLASTTSLKNSGMTSPYSIPGYKLHRKLSEKFLLVKELSPKTRNQHNSSINTLKSNLTLTNKNFTVLRPTITVTDYSEIMKNGKKPEDAKRGVKPFIMTPSKYKPLAIIQKPKEDETRKVLEKYVRKIKNVSKPVRKISDNAIPELFEEFFEDFSNALPQYKELFGMMKGLAESLKHPCESLEESAETREAEFSDRVSENHPLHLRIKPAKIRRIVPNIKSSTDLPVESLCKNDLREEVKKAESDRSDLMQNSDQSPKKIAIPKLNMERISGDQQDYNEEFLKKMNEFSNSWRLDAQHIRTIGK